MGQIILLTSFIFTGLASLVVMLLLLMFWWLPALQEAREVLELLLLLFPPYALGRCWDAFYTSSYKSFDTCWVYLWLLDHLYKDSPIDQLVDVPVPMDHSDYIPFPNTRGCVYLLLSDHKIPCHQVSRFLYFDSIPLLGVVGAVVRP